MLPLMASFTPLRYPIPYAISEAATVQPTTKSQVSPLGKVHAQCMSKIAPRSPIRDAPAPMPTAPIIASMMPVPAWAAALGYQFNRWGGTEVGSGCSGRR